jgi:tetratricopeptide (TPR) repeat protein
MKQRIPAAFITIVMLALAVAGQKLEPPRLEPTPSTPSQKQLIKQGVSLHDKGDYDGAISLYQQVLNENPNDIGALYEMSYSYYAQKNYKKSIEVGYKAAQYKSSLLHAIYVQIGSCFDELGDSKRAIEVYKAGIKLTPSSSLLQYNLAITYYRSQRPDEARVAVKRAAALDPNHPGSQLLLSSILNDGPYKLPSLLAALRFLVLEPGSKRSPVALQIVKNQMQAGVTPGKDGNNINVIMATRQKKDEGNFESVEFFMSLLKAGNDIEKNKDKTEIQLLTENFNSLFGLLSESSDKADFSKFTWKYYVPYFVELKKQGHTEAFAYYINQQSQIAGVDEWLEQNQGKVADFLTWSKSYRWPKID